MVAPYRQLAAEQAIGKPPHHAEAVAALFLLLLLLGSFRVNVHFRADVDVLLVRLLAFAALVAAGARHRVRAGAFAAQREPLRLIGLWTSFIEPQQQDI